VIRSSTGTNTGTDERDVMVAVFNCTPVPSRDSRVGVLFGGRSVASSSCRRRRAGAPR